MTFLRLARQNMVWGELRNETYSDWGWYITKKQKIKNFWKKFDFFEKKSDDIFRQDDFQAKFPI